MRPTPDTTLIEHLADFACGMDAAALPREVIKQAKLCVLDTVGCMIAGSRLDDGRALVAAERSMSKVEEATVIGTATKLSVEAAARVNGYHGDVLELNDLIGGHASIASVTTALAVGEFLGLNGITFLRALVAGIEVTARINLGYRQSHRGHDSKLASEVAIASPGIPNTFGASVVAALAFRLPAEKVAEALAIAGTMAGWCPIEAVAGRGGSIKPIMFGGWPSSVGIQAAKYARHGVTGPRRLLESPTGFYSTVAKDFDPTIVRGSLGWQLENPRRKWHACCGYNHAAIDGVSALLQEQGPSLFKNATVEVGLVDYAAERMSTDSPPVSVQNARFHAKYCLALAMQGCDVILPEHCLNYTEFLKDPVVLASMAQIRVKPAPEVEHYSKCTIRIVGPEGERAFRRVEAPKGYPGNPMSDDDVIAKFKRLASPVLRDPDRFISKLMDLDELESIAFVMSGLVADRATTSELL